MTEQEVRYAILQAQDKAEQGDVISQHFLGISYLGLKDYILAAKWFEKAAEQGYADAQMKLGLQLFTGQGIPEDKVKGIEWIRKAAEQGYARAQFHMGNFTDDKIKAAEWYEKAAEQGDADAQYELGVLYLNGDSITKDSDKAIKWFNKAVDQGHVKAKEFMDAFEAEKRKQRDSPDDLLKSSAMLVQALEDNRLGNYSRSTELLKYVEEYGAPFTQFQLGCLYLEGRSLSRNPTKAKELIKKAAEKGDFQAKEWLEKEKREQEERERKEREHQEWLASEEGQKWQAEEKEREKRELEEKEAQKRRWKIGRIAAPLLTVFSIIMVSVGFNGETNGEPGGIIPFVINISLIIPFLVIYFCLGIKRIIFLIVGIFLAISWAFNASGDTLTFFITFFISYLISCVLAMINKKDKF